MTAMEYSCLMHTTVQHSIISNYNEIYTYETLMQFVKSYIAMLSSYVPHIIRKGVALWCT